jgi:hypothetical protein
MKNLKDYINRVFTNESKDGDYIKIDFTGIDGGADVVSSIKSIATSHTITYSSDSQEDVKLKLDASKEDGFEKISEVVTEFINSISAEDHDNIGDKLDRLNNDLEKLQDWLDDLAVPETDDTVEE